MRVLIVSSYFPPHVGGVEVVAERQARLLAAAGHHVVVATGRHDRSLPATEIRDGYDLRRLPMTNVIERRFGIPYPVIGPGAVRGLRRLVTGSDLVHLHDVLYQLPQTAALLATAAGRPLYLTQHVGARAHANGLVNRVEHLVDRYAGAWVRPRVSRFVCYHALSEQHLRSSGVPAERIVRGRIGVETDVFTPAGVAPGGEPIVLFVGRIADNKGYRHVLNLARPGRQIVLAGPGRPAEPLPAGVTHLGPLTREQLVDLYRAAAVFVLPSEGETFPLAAQEAMACGTPVVLSDGPGYTGFDVDRRLLRLVPPEAAVLDRTVDEILGDAELRRRMGAYARHLAVTHFDAAAGRRSLIDLYDPIHISAKGSRWTSPLWS
ncbi:glycosyltransferase family 4 protein [Actinoplanes sp. GCM10030250]|uniref:glycosyltransferase family 4 protein n=1 Tax=Actinoplanes sp. GCM10030250 TaxID=3273376 RepID=UPI00361D6A87